MKSSRKLGYNSFSGGFQNETLGNFKGVYMSYYDRFNGKSKFRQDGSYRPKSKNTNKTEWRARKGFAKDQGKTEAFCNCGRYLKAYGNRQNRRWSKRMIHTEKFDQLYYHQDMFVSSWDAC